MTTTSRDAYTPLESLFLLRGIAKHGLDQQAFHHIADVLQQNRLIKTAPSYDAARLRPEPLQELFLHLLWDELKQEHDTPGPKPDGGLSPNSKRRRLQPPPLPTLREAHQYVPKIESLYRKLEQAYVNQTLQEIEQYERSYDRVQSEVRVLEQAVAREEEQERRQKIPDGVPAPAQDGPVPLAHKPSPALGPIPSPVSVQGPGPRLPNGASHGPSPVASPRIASPRLPPPQTQSPRTPSTPQLPIPTPPPPPPQQQQQPPPPQQPQQPQQQQPPPPQQQQQQQPPIPPQLPPQVSAHIPPRPEVVRHASVPSPTAQVPPVRSSPAPLPPTTLPTTLPPTTTAALQPQLVSSPRLGHHNIPRGPITSGPGSPRPMTAGGIPHVLQPPASFSQAPPQPPQPPKPPTPTGGLPRLDGVAGPSRQSPVLPPAHHPATTLPQPQPSIPGQAQGGQLKWEPPYQPQPGQRPILGPGQQHPHYGSPLSQSPQPLHSPRLPSHPPPQQAQQHPAVSRPPQSAPMKPQVLIPPQTGQHFAPPLQPAPIRSMSDSPGPSPVRQPLASTAAAGIPRANYQQHPSPYPPYHLPQHLQQGAAVSSPPQSPSAIPPRLTHGLAAPQQQQSPPPLPPQQQQSPQHQPQALQAPPPFSQLVPTSMAPSPSLPPIQSEVQRAYPSPYPPQVPQATHSPQAHPPQVPHPPQVSHQHPPPTHQPQAHPPQAPQVSPVPQVSQAPQTHVPRPPQAQPLPHLPHPQQAPLPQVTQAQSPRIPPITHAPQPPVTHVPQGHVPHPAQQQQQQPQPQPPIPQHRPRSHSAVTTHSGSRFSPITSVTQVTLVPPAKLGLGSGTKWLCTATPSTPKLADVRAAGEEIRPPAVEPLSPVAQPAVLPPARPSPARQPTSEASRPRGSLPLVGPQPTPASQARQQAAQKVSRPADKTAAPEQPSAAKEPVKEPEPATTVKNEVGTPQATVDTGDTTADESVTGKRQAARQAKRKRDELSPTPAGTATPANEKSEQEATAGLPDANRVLWSRGFHKVSASAMEQIVRHRSANMFAAPIREKDAPGYHKVILQPQDLKSIRAAIAHGNRSATQAAAALPGGDPGHMLVWLPQMEELVPPKGIINTAQLDRELAHMFSNAIMYNPDRWHGPGSSFLADREEKADDSNTAGGHGHGHGHGHPGDVLGYKVDEFGVVKDARAMFSEADSLLADLRVAEDGRIKAMMEDGTLQVLKSGNTSQNHSRAASKSAAASGSAGGSDEKADGEKVEEKDASKPSGDGDKEDKEKDGDVSMVGDKEVEDGKVDEEADGDGEGTATEAENTGGSGSNPNKRRRVTRGEKA